MNKIFFAFCTLAGALLLGSCQQKQIKAYFLTESSNPEGGAAFNVRYDGRMYNRMPIMSLKHFEKFRSFMAEDGSYGIVLYTPKEYINRLFTETQQNIGKHLLPVIGGLAYQPLEIDCGITDGQLIIWGGLNGYDLKRLSKVLKPATPEIEEKRYLDEDPRPLPELPESAAPVKDEHGRIIPELFSSALRNNSPASSEKATGQKQQAESSTVPQNFSTRSQKKQ
ncbi:MAG: hypothetical protein IKY92_05495 [Akkermansia sp.]|nr:hypothetical protein [Akkermansia sp.]